MINRSAILLNYKAPAVHWINTVGPQELNQKISTHEVNVDRTVYLVRIEEAEDAINLKQWIGSHFLGLFEKELEGWVMDRSLWPQPLSLSTFNQWFNIECHTVLEDTVGEQLVDDGPRAAF